MRHFCFAVFTCVTLLSSLLVGNESVLAADKIKVAFMAGTPSHGYGAHEHNAGCIMLAKLLEEAMPNVEAVVFQNGWPEDKTAFDDADTVVMYCDGGGRHPVNAHLEQLDRLAKKGVGVVCLHYGVEVPIGPSGEKLKEWIGGYFEVDWSVNPHWTAEFKSFPKHPTTRGVKPFAINDEWYYHMKFRDGMKGVTPILTAIPPESTLVRKDGPHSGNPHVRAKMGQPQHVAWASENEGGGRGFGFTGGHYHWNWGDPNFRKVVLNAIVWTAHGEVPKNGVALSEVTIEDLEENQDFEPNAQRFDREEVIERLKIPSRKKSDAGKEAPESALLETGKNAIPTSFVSTPVVSAAQDQRSPEQAVAGLDIAEGLEATLAGSEPELLSLTNLDIDHRGRVWVCEVVNYRKNNGKRPEGDRILCLEDTTGDGKLDSKKVFYQGNDVDSALGICVLGNRVIVSAAPNVIIFTDDDGDDVADRKEMFFTKTGQPQHDHSAHTFIFGPDGKLYWNFGNTGKAVHDKDGNIVVDKVGNKVLDNGEPYFGGMPFRCNLDGSEFEVLAHNFRNNYETTVDSFGTLWQSDNDDDGNFAVRINYVMEHGNFGYKGELTKGGWKENRTGMHEEIPLKHWHLRDPGVVPNLLQTGAGSPTGILVYEGRLLPKQFWDQMIHCDAGPNVVRSYPVKKDGAGYSAEIVNIMEGTRDKWFRPADVCVAPDGSLFVTDWYDPGVGGHNMGDIEKGRLFRVAPPGHKYEVPKFDFSTAAGAVEALKNPNLSVRYMAWTALHEMGNKAEPALLELYQDSNPRFRARALWLLGKIDEGRGQHYVDLAAKDENEDIRITAIRLAKQLDLDMVKMVSSMVRDESPQVRRELAIALRDTKLPIPASFLWAELALQHDGKDRWYLEALGIGAEKNWDVFFEAYLKNGEVDRSSAAFRDIVWRSRSKYTSEQLAKIIMDPKTKKEDSTRYFRAFDFQKGKEKDKALESLLLLQ